MRREVTAGELDLGGAFWACGTLIRSVICNGQSAGWTSSPGLVRLGSEDILMHRAPFMIQKRL